MDKETLKKGGVAICEEAFVLKVSRDCMQAFVVAKIENAVLPGTDKLQPVLEQNGISTGILPRPTPGEGGTYVVAKGRAPQNGENAKVRFYVKPSVVRAPKIKEPEKGGKVDYRELGGLNNVKVDQLLLEKIPLTQGTAGVDVFGSAVAAKPGRDLKLKLGNNVRFEEAEKKLYATVNGKFVMADEKAAVYEEHLISENVDLTTGNVTFGGRNLEIGGAVLPGFKVRCRGDIHIAKGINNAEILAGGNLSILGGVLGENAHVTAMGNATIDFIENGPKIRVSGNMLIKDAAIQADIEIGGSLKAFEGKGLVVGGRYVIGGSAWVRELGSEGEVITELTVGIKPSLEKQKEKLAREKEVWPTRMSETLKNINGLTKMKKEAGGKLDADKQQLLDKYNAFLPKVMEKVNQLTEMEEQINAEITKSADECIFVYGKLYPGIKVRIGSALRVVGEMEERVSVRLNKQNLQIQIHPMTADELAMFNQ